MREPISRFVAVPRPWPITSLVLLVALMAFGVAWEWFLDPLRPGGSWLVLKTLPLAFAISGLYHGRMQTFRWMSLLIWLYVGEALVRILGLTATERGLASMSLALSLALAASILLGARSQIKVVKANLKSTTQTAD